MTALRSLPGHLHLWDPANSRPGPGVLVIHDYYGRLPHVDRICDRLARAGYVVAAPDLYDGLSTTAPEEAEDLMHGLEEATALSKIEEGLATLRSHPTVTPDRVAAVGFSMGGWLALRVAALGRVDAAVAYYSMLEPGETIDCPVLIHLAEEDDWDPPDRPQKFVAGLQNLGKPAVSMVHAGTSHSFANEDVPAFDETAARQAWDATVGFLATCLLEGERPTPEDFRVWAWDQSAKWSHKP